MSARYTSPATCGASLLPLDMGVRRRLLAYSRYFWIRASHEKCVKGRLIGLHGLVALLGVELAERTLKRAYSAKTDKITCRFRRGLRITFYIR